MKSTILQFFVFGLLTLGAVSCTNDQAETENLYIDSPDDDEVKEEPGEG
ncbi:hypothetical protein L0P88_05375 [Muricauda sp. SCSIO 64092]|nr:hypothetical protein [Muricauda sp. SCSIO 64092]UOY07982.1 hypothetical protein L0P88_05375 [Muricauda sp. SCSIO 64092]